MRFPLSKTKYRCLNARSLLAFASIAVLMIVALVGFAVQNQSAKKLVGPQATVAGLPPFANQDYDLWATPPVVSFPENGGSVRVQIMFKATELTRTEVLLLEAHANIPGYSASFDPTSVTLQPGGSTSAELTVTIPGGVQNGVYPMSILARGETTQGGTWLVIIVGLSQTAPPP
jgi:hypothetical protein